MPDSVTGLAAAPGRDRIRAFDLARGLAVVFMVCVHVLWHWGDPSTWRTPIGGLISILGGPTAAPTFMFLMGASLAFSSRSSFAWLAARGTWLVFLGYLLNLLRGAIPATLGLATGVVTADQIAPFTPWFLATTVDIHQMAGLSLVAIALLRSRTSPGWLWLGIGGAIVLAAPWLRSLQFGTPLLDGPLTPVLGNADNVYYAIVPWLWYPLAGGVFGTVLARASDRTRLFRIGGLLGVGLGLAGLGLLALQQPAFDVSTYWHEPVSYAVGITGIVLVWLAACDILARQAWLDRRLGLVYGWSRRVIPMYFTHWVIVGWGVGVVGFRDLPLELVLPSMAVALFLTAKLSPLAVSLESTPAWLVRLWSGRRAAATAEAGAAA
ncbi:MAG TPA: heparan-alpha-glucosaminide N-acetyltransferase domain-containing protein [Candidatus Limnocylindrales bacterium]